MIPGSSVFARLAAHARTGPVVVAHRGDSEHWPENTLPAFAAALRLGVVMQEFDVRATRDGVLVCLHDATFDRTTDAATKLGPGALVAQCLWSEVRGLAVRGADAAPAEPARVPTLAEVLALLAPDCIAMVEHKAGPADAFVAELRRAGAVERCILQSFDWEFVAAARRAEPELALALLGPTATCPQPSAAAITAAHRAGAGMLHWSAAEWTREQIERCHAAGLLACSYTTDDDLGFRGGGALGLDAMCTNRPARMLALAAAAAHPSNAPAEPA